MGNPVSHITDRPPHQTHDRTDILPALRLEPHSAFLVAHHLSRLSCPVPAERSTTLDLEDFFTIPSGLIGRPTILPQSFRPTTAFKTSGFVARLGRPKKRDWEQAEYLKLGHSAPSLVREGVFKVKVMSEGANEPLTEN